MKLSINLLPPEPEKQIRKIRQQTVISYSLIALLIFMLINMGIFAFYWFLTRDTANKLAAIKTEESKITSLAEVEKLYRATGAKLQFLTTAWQNKTSAQAAVRFSQSLTVEGTIITKISLKEDNSITLTVQSQNSDSLEKFLNGVIERQKNGEIKGAKIVSTKRDEKGLYTSSINFKFLSP